MYTKAELLENKKMEKILRENKYKLRTMNIKKNKKAKMEKYLDIAFCIIFGSFMTYFIYEVVAYLYVRL